MPALVLAARLLLAGVFAVAAITKLTDVAGTRKAVHEFGVPDALSAPAAALLPLAELAVAIALLFSATAWWAGIGALALLLIFLAAIGFNLARGRTPDCHCFGQVASGPIGSSTIVRNVLLSLVAGGVIWQSYARPGLDALGWLTRLNSIERAALGLGVLALALLGVEAWVLLQLVAQNGRLLLKLEALETKLATGPIAAGAPAAPAPAQPPVGLPVGAAAPAFSLTGLFGETMTLDALRSAGKPVLLTFTDPGCGPCQALMPDLGRWQREMAGSLSLVLMSRETPDANRAKAAEQGLSQVLLQQDREVMTAYQAFGTPSAVVVQPDGSIGSPLAQGAEEIRALVARLAGPTLGAALPLMPYPPPAGAAAPCPHCGQVHAQAPSQAAPVLPQGLATGTPAPALKLRDLSGNEVDLAGFRGRETVMLFWNTGCGFCQQMLPQLKDWEQQRPTDAPALVVVSAGTTEALQAQGLASTILLDQSFTAGSAFGASGTPSAVKVSRDGTIAAPLAVGGPAVMALLSGQPQAAAGPAAAVAPPPAVRSGDPAPDFALPDLDGRAVSLSDYRGRRTMLLFWSPSCGFCQQMLQDLRRWEVQRTASAPEILVVSTGAVQENRLLGLRSSVVLDTDMSAGQKFGANGTPMAVLIDAEGRVASELAVGADAVLALAGRPASAA